jgi:predicted ArsR family transcriptional regulator
MEEDKYIMVSMDDEKSKHLAGVLDDPTAKKILTLLSQKDASEADIANDLQIPASTAEYNIQKLVASGLIEKSEDFFWSVKGKKIPIYKLSKKYIVIAPKNKSRVSGFFATLILSIAAAALLGLYEKSKTAAVSESLQAGKEAAISTAATTSLGSIALWFLIGALFALIVLMLLRKVVRR